MIEYKKLFRDLRVVARSGKDGRRERERRLVVLGLSSVEGGRVGKDITENGKIKNVLKKNVHLLCVPLEFFTIL